jgi:hypothetical protein
MKTQEYFSGMTKILMIVFFWFVYAVHAHALDSPHSSVNIITCESCHYTDTSSPFWGSGYSPADSDDTPFNALCNSCHDQTGGGGGIDRTWGQQP